jgi:hypothetical protein
MHSSHCDKSTNIAPTLCSSTLPWLPSRNQFFSRSRKPLQLLDLGHSRVGTSMWNSHLPIYSLFKNYSNQQRRQDTQNIRTINSKNDSRSALGDRPMHSVIYINSNVHQTNQQVKKNQPDLPTALSHLTPTKLQDFTLIGYWELD